MKFAGNDRRRIAELLELAQETAISQAGLEVIERVLGASSERRAAWLRERRLLATPPGRPPTDSMEILHDLHFLAFIYEYTTGRVVRRTRSKRGSKRRDRNTFYELAQVCLRQADPAALIGVLLGTFWHPDRTDEHPYGISREVWRKQYSFFDELPLGLNLEGLEFVEAIRAAGFRPSTVRPKL